jgi:hypothetical protein
MSVSIAISEALQTHSDQSLARVQRLFEREGYEGVLRPLIREWKETKDPVERSRLRELNGALFAQYAEVFRKLDETKRMWAELTTRLESETVAA